MNLSKANRIAMLIASLKKVIKRVSKKNGIKGSKIHVHIISKYKYIKII